MARIAWDAAGTRFFEAGVDRGVLYVGAAAGVPWVGLIAVDENPSGAEPRPYYIDGIKYLNLPTLDEFEATIRAYTYPPEFGQCDGSARIRNGLNFGQQPRKSFGFTYRTMVGNEVQGTQHGYKLHMVYNALAVPSSRTASSISGSAEATEFSWAISTRSRPVAGSAPTAHVTVDSRYTHPVTLQAIEDILYGSESTVARLPTPEELVTIFDVPVEWEVLDNEDGTFEVSGPDEFVQDIGGQMVLINHPSVTVVDEDTFTITY